MGYFHEDFPDKDPSRIQNTEWPKPVLGFRANKVSAEYLQSRRLSVDIATMNGWYPSYMDVLRIVIPCQTQKEGHVYYQARSVGKHKLRYRSPFGPRYGALCHVASSFEGNSDVVVVTEGPMDALAFAGQGFDSIATMGISPDIETVDCLVKACKSRSVPVAIVFNNEPEASAHASALGLYLAANGIVAYSFVPSANDFAAMSDKERKTLAGVIRRWGSQLKSLITSSGKYRRK